MNSTKFCTFQVTHEFREESNELARAKRQRIERIFANALIRHGQTLQSTND